jgi:hypothetical protein
VPVTVLRGRLKLGETPLLVLVLVFEAEAVALRVGGLTGSLLGEPRRGWSLRSSVSDEEVVAAAVVDEWLSTGFRRERERAREDDMMSGHDFL